MGGESVVEIGLFAYDRDLVLGHFCDCRQPRFSSLVGQSAAKWASERDCATEAAA